MPSGFETSPCRTKCTTVMARPVGGPPVGLLCVVMAGTAYPPANYRQDVKREPRRNRPRPSGGCCPRELESVQQASLDYRSGVLPVAGRCLRHRHLPARGGGHRRRVAPVPDRVLVGVLGGNRRPAGWLFPVPATRLRARRPVARVPDRP